jgi:hypothetical protein
MEKTLFMPLCFLDSLQNALLSFNLENPKIEILKGAIKFTAFMTESEMFNLGITVGQNIMMENSKNFGK